MAGRQRLLSEGSGGSDIGGAGAGGGGLLVAVQRAAEKDTACGARRRCSRCGPCLCGIFHHSIAGLQSASRMSA